MPDMDWKTEAEIYAKAQAPKESCGIFALINGQEKFWPCKNIAEDQENFFALDPEDWAACEDEGGEILGVFHSHPQGGSELSKTDKISCELIGYPYYIYSIKENNWNKYTPDSWEKPKLKKNIELIDSPKLKTIKVYGKLKDFLGQSVFQAAVKTPIQAMNFFKANFTGIEKHMNNQIYRVKMGCNSVTGDLLNMSGQGDIQIIPVAIGAGWFDWVGDVFDFIGDTVSTAVNWVSNNILTVGVTLATGGLGGLLKTVGTNLLLSGVSGLLSPQRPTSSASSVGDTDPNIRGSYNFNGIQNISTSGVPIPIIYGLVFTGSIIISSGIDTAQIVKEL
jgi:predicted phage tail protein/proteasome lid subunit RPN8/RPN11